MRSSPIDSLRRNHSRLSMEVSWLSGLCRIGVFYDGSYVSYAQRHYYYDKAVGWLDLRAFHTLVEGFVRGKEPNYPDHKIVYAAWFQGSFPSAKAAEKQLRFDRNLQHDMMHAGIELKYLPMSTSRGEKGVDVALAVDALCLGLSGKVDVVVLVTGDGDFVPLARELFKNGIRVAAAYFNYEAKDHPSYASDRLLSTVNYQLDVSSLETDKARLSVFNSLFRPSDQDHKGQHRGQEVQ